MSPRCSGGKRVIGVEITVTSIGDVDAGVTMVVTGGPCTAPVPVLRIEYWLLTTCGRQPARTVSVTLPEPFAGTFATFQRMVDPDCVPPPVADTNTTPAGSRSSMMTPVAVCVPVFV